jgi:IS605 OrfB family transposase
MGYRVEQHQIKPGNPVWDYCVTVTSASADLFNEANDLTWISWNYGHGWILQPTLDKQLKDTLAYKALPAKVSQLVLKQVADSWTSWHKALQDWKINSRKYKGKPKPPGHINGGNLVKFNDQAVSKVGWKQGFVQPSMSPISIPVKEGLTLTLPKTKKNPAVNGNFVEVRIVPKTGCFNIEVVYDDGLSDWKIPDKELGAAIDVGLDNLAMLTFSDPTIQPISINGKPLKSINQWANKQNAKYRSLLGPEQTRSNRLDAIWRKRNNQVNDFLHKATKRVVDELSNVGVTCVAIGKNIGWKDLVNIGKRNNQKFVTVPHARFIDMLARKLEAVGITVKVDEESYTSRASFLDWDNIPTWQPGNTEKHHFSGKRIKTKSYQSKNGSLINADVNGSFNIGRKVIPNYFGETLKFIVEQDSGKVVAFPRRINPLKTIKVKDMSGSAHV